MKAESTIQHCILIQVESSDHCYDVGRFEHAISETFFQLLST